jgi:hypothetical protein
VKIAASNVFGALFTGDYIKEKYDSATEVRVSRRGRLQLRDPRFTLPTASDLVYLDDSPNYCIRDMSVGSLGEDQRTRSRRNQNANNLLCFKLKFLDILYSKFFKMRWHFLLKNKRKTRASLKY